MTGESNSCVYFWVPVSIEVTWPELFVALVGVVDENELIMVPAEEQVYRPLYPGTGKHNSVTNANRELSQFMELIYVAGVKNVYQQYSVQIF